LLDGIFNTRPFFLHLCLSEPCLAAAYPDVDLDRYLHVTRVRLWSWSNYAEQGPGYVPQERLERGLKVLEKRIKDTKSPRPRKSTPKTGRAPRAKTASKKSPTGEEKPKKKEKAKPAELSAEKLREKLWKTKERLQAASGTSGPTLEVADSEEDLGETGASTSDDSDSVEHELVRRGRLGDEDSGLAAGAHLI
jgi:hypothetical protein